MEIKYKQYIIINKDLDMSIGKSCAMTAHASYLALREQGNNLKGKKLINSWLNNGECVIVLEAYTSSQMFGLQQYFNRKKIINHLYIDEGLTEIPMGEPTALATGVLNEEESEWLATMNLYGNETELEIIERKKEELAIELNKKVNKEIYGYEFDDYPRNKKINPIFNSIEPLYKFVWGREPKYIFAGKKYEF